MSSRRIFYSWCIHACYLHSFPTRRSSDLSLPIALRAHQNKYSATRRSAGRWYSSSSVTASGRSARDRKSTRLNSSHVASSYAVFCLKKEIDGTDNKGNLGANEILGVSIAV